MPGNMPMPPHPHMIPPQASYHPASFPPDQYDAYYDSYKRHRSPRSKRKVSILCRYFEALGRPDLIANELPCALAQMEQVRHFNTFSATQ